MALDISELDAPPKERRRRQEESRKDLLDRGEEVRYEDSRGRGERVDKGQKSYSAGQGAKGRGEEYDPARSAREAPRPELKVEPPPEPAPARPAPEPVSPPPPAARPAQELAPHERTMALDLDRMRAGESPMPPRPAPAPPMPMPPAASAELGPNEKTQALDLASIQGAAGMPLPSTQALQPVSGPMSAAPEHTTMLDANALEAYRAAEADSGARLIIFVEGNDPIVFDLRPGITNIGRDKSNHLVLSDPSASRKHLRLKKNPEGHFDLKEQGAENRTLVNGILNGDHILSHGDDIQVGATVMRFVLGEPTEGDFVWPNMVHNIPQSGHTAAVSAIMEEPAIPAPRKKTSKLLIGILVVLIVGTIVLAALVIVFFAYGDKILGG